jgi:hypothetical protein
MFRLRRPSSEQKIKPSDSAKQVKAEIRDGTSLIHERPRICALDFEDDVIQALNSRGFNCYKGTLGSIIKVPNTLIHAVHQCLLYIDLPSNLHEYDIIMVDLHNPKYVEYVEKEHIHDTTKSQKQHVFLSKFPQKLFDPRAISANILKNYINQLMKKESILIVFAAEQERIEYHGAVITSRGSEALPQENYTISIWCAGRTLHGYWPQPDPGLLPGKQGESDVQEHRRGAWALASGVSSKPSPPTQYFEY